MRGRANWGSISAALKVHCGFRGARSFSHSFFSSLLVVIVAPFCGSAVVRAQGELTDLGVLHGGLYSTPVGVSADGSIVSGYAADGAAGNALRAFRWTQATGIVSLGTLNGGTSSIAYGMNLDGSVIVGSSANGAAGNRNHAFRWTQSTGMVSLGTLNGGSSSSATSVNADGSVVVGFATDGAPGNHDRAFRWTQSTGMVSLGTLNGGSSSFARSVNADGSVVAGTASDGAAGNAFRAFRWTQSTGMVSLGTLNGGSSSNANAVNADGSVVVGSSEDGAAGDVLTAFRWTQATGMQSVKEWLTAAGVRVAPGVGLQLASGVSADGSVVVGVLGSHAFIARVSGIGSGMITQNDLVESLSSVIPQITAIDTGNMILHGAHGNPLLGRVPPGQSCVWAAGDWGRDDHGQRDGSLGLAEFGVCRSFASGVQLGATLGKSRSSQHLVFGGNARHDGDFGTVEATMKLGTSDLWGTLTGLYHGGDADIRRGYFNAGTLDSSRGTAETRTWGMRARLDWENAIRAGQFGFSPYGELSYIRTRMDAYTETEGGFPAKFNARSENNTELRLGINSLIPRSDRVRLLGTLEAVHRFDGDGARNTGQVLGLFAFDVPSRLYKRDWLRVGIGLDGKVGGGTASIMLNTTTKSEAPSYWLAASYRVAF